MTENVQLSVFTPEMYFCQVLQKQSMVQTEILFKTVLLNKPIT